jgi:hypothetical protein
MKRKIFFTALSMLGLALLSATAAQAQKDYTATVQVAYRTPTGILATGPNTREIVGNLYNSYWARTTALVWDSPNNSSTLTPLPGGDDYAVYGISATNKVGSSNNKFKFWQNAVLWENNSETPISLHPVVKDSSLSGESCAVATSGGQQVGWWGDRTPSPRTQAILWGGTARAFVNLNPAGFFQSAATGVLNGEQVGWGDPYNSGVRHALLWSGSARSAIDLNPSWTLSSTATCIGRQDPRTKLGTTYQGGYCGSKYKHATIWYGTAESAVDIHPKGFENSIITSCEDRPVDHLSSVRYQVGFGDNEHYGSAIRHALVWRDTAASCIDLHLKLPEILDIKFVSSEATGVSRNGEIVGTATDEKGNIYAILWSPVW